jgi:hypothetical protein
MYVLQQPLDSKHRQISYYSREVHLVCLAGYSLELNLDQEEFLKAGILVCRNWVLLRN